MKKRMVAAIICLSLGILFGGIGLYKYMEEKQAGTEYEKIREEVVEKTNQKKPQTETLPEEKQEEPSAVDIPIDFQALQQQNPEVYAWTILFCRAVQTIVII